MTPFPADMAAKAKSNSASGETGERFFGLLAILLLNRAKSGRRACLNSASTVAFDDIHDPLTVMFPGGKTRALADVSFLLGRLRGEKMSRIRLIFAPELREEIIRALAPS